MNEVRNIIVGFDFGEEVSQLCYYNRRTGEPESLPIRVGTGQYTFPNCLSKKPGEEEWHFGLEVEFFVSRQEEIYLDNLYQLCTNSRMVMIDGQERKVGELLGIFLLHALKTLGVPDPLRSISGLMITTPHLSAFMVENIKSAWDYIGVSKKRCFLQDYEESFYYHTLFQKNEIWSRKVALFSFDEDEVAYSALELDKKGKPIVGQVKRGKRITLHKEAKERDEDFFQLIQESMSSDIFSSVFLVGKGFEREWSKRSLGLLCRQNRHVFYGNNLFAKGACYAAREKTEERNLKGYLYYGNDLVKRNVGMEMTISGVQAYYPLIQSGVNWYEAMNECEILLDDTRELIFQVSDMDNSKKECYSMELSGIPTRPPKATRILLKVECEAANRCRIEVTDLGFGEMYPSSGLSWKEIMKW